jgi:hypothetical protein
MFSTKGQEVKTAGGQMKSFQAGVVYAHIFNGYVRTSKNGDKKSLELILEGPELENFEGWSIDKNDPEGPKFKGLSSRVTATIWTDQFNETNVMKNEILQKLTVIAGELGLRDAVDSISAVSLEDWVAQAISILKGHDMYWFLKGNEEEYNGKTIIKLSLPKYKFASVDEARLDKFDKNNQYHYKALITKAVSSFEPVNDDFDM